jgi:hypothetical protein
MGLWQRSLNMSYFYVFHLHINEKVIFRLYISTYTLIRDLTVPLQKKLYNQTDAIMFHVWVA